MDATIMSFWTYGFDSQSYKQYGCGMLRYAVSALGHSRHTDAVHVSIAAHASKAAQASNTTITVNADAAIRLDFWSCKYGQCRCGHMEMLSY